MIVVSRVASRIAMSDAELRVLDNKIGHYRFLDARNVERYLPGVAVARTPSPSKWCHGRYFLRPLDSLGFPASPANLAHQAPKVVVDVYAHVCFVSYERWKREE